MGKLCNGYIKGKVSDRQSHKKKIIYFCAPVDMLKTATKKSISYLLLFLAAVPLLYILTFKFQQHAIRQKMKSRLEAHVLHTISIPEHQVHWIKNGKEIKVNGKMFDIKSFQTRDGVCVFTGLYDHEETALRNQLQKEQENNSSNSKQLTQLFQLLQSFYNDSHGEFFFPDHLTGSDMIKDNTRLLTQFISIITPPPRA